MKDLKYPATYILPLLGFISFNSSGIFTFSTLIFVFVVVPLLEPFLPSDKSNLTVHDSESKAKNIIFEMLLYLNIPLVFGLLVYFFYILKFQSYTIVEFVGMFTAVGLTLPSAGINVAHELGHRKEWYHRAMSVLLLTPSLYNHFIIEHNLGHHKNVATKEDPASARKNETVYKFWLRSVLTGYINAWNLEKKRLETSGRKFFSIYYQMIGYSFFAIALVYLYGGWLIVLSFVGLAIFSFLNLETINYIEHYGLRREKNENGRYQRVQPWHSWNSNHELGRILLYELTRHSDHYSLANKKYLLLEHHDNAKQLPLCYPTAMLVSLLPPLWFKLMNNKI